MYHKLNDTDGIKFWYKPSWINNNLIVKSISLFYIGYSILGLGHLLGNKYRFITLRFIKVSSKIIVYFLLFLREDSSLCLFKTQVYRLIIIVTIIIFQHYIIN